MAKKKKAASKRYTTRPNQDPKRRSQLIKQILISLAIIAVISVTIFFLVLRNSSQISIAENAIGSLLTPVQNAFSTVTGGVKEFFTTWRNYNTLEDEYEKLLKENQQLSLELADAEETLIENERLLGLLDARSAYKALDPIYAKVIARDAGQWFSTFSINRGEMHGVSAGMAVVNGEGLIGRVYEVGYNYSKVLTIIDPRSGLACLVQRTRDNGIMRGGVSDTDDSAECYIYYLPNVNNIMPGDVIVTSGTDQIYPKGLTIGTVSQVSLNAGSEGNYAVVAPAVDFLHIEEVLILRNVVETDDTGYLAPLPTATPAPTASPSPTPDANAAPTVNPNVTEGNWNWPSADSNGSAGNNVILETLPEDEWAAD